MTTPVPPSVPTDDQDGRSAAAEQADDQDVRSDADPLASLHLAERDRAAVAEVLADPTPESRPVEAWQVLWHSTKRVFVIIGGFALLLGGVAMLVLPGPGLLVIIAGLALLAREFVWADRLLQKARAKASQGAAAAKQAFRRDRS